MFFTDVLWTSLHTNEKDVIQAARSRATISGATRASDGSAATIAYEGATLGDLREAVSTLEELAPTARRVLGGAHPLTGWIESELQQAQATLAARDTPPANA